MLKTKSKFKLLLALGIMLLAMLLLGTTKVNATSEMTKQEIAAFNAQFEAYAGTKVSGANIRSLLQAITASNTSNSHKISSVKYNYKTYYNFDVIKNQIVNSTKYSVSFDKDMNGIINKVIINNAIDVTEEKLQTILSLIPNTIQLNIPENECEKTTNVIWASIKKILRDNFYTSLSSDFKEHIIAVEGIQIEIIHNGNYLKDINKATIKVSGTINGNNKSKQKDIKLEYNNHNKYNSADESYAKNLKITSPIYYDEPSMKESAEQAQYEYKRATEYEGKLLKICEEYINNINNGQQTTQIEQQEDNLMLEYATYGNIYTNKIEKYYTNTINDNSIMIKVYLEEPQRKDGMNTNNWVKDGIYIGIFKNGVLYDVRKMESKAFIPTEVVPGNVKEEELNNFLINSNSGISKIVKGTKSVLGVDIPNGYTIYYTTGKNYCIIMDREKIDVTFTAIDDTTNIKAEANEGVIPANAILVTVLEKDTGILNVVKLSLKDTSTKYIPYDITFQSAGVKVEPNGNVKISIPIPTDYDKTKLAVYRVEDNGDKTEYKVTVEGNYATFETNHFSTYVLAEKEVTQNTVNTETIPTKPVTEDRKKDDTPKTGTISSIYFMIPVTVISAIGIIAFRKKETK